MSVYEQLILNREEKYRQFQEKLNPGVEGIIGVRLPVLRKIAKKIAKDNPEYFIKNNSDFYFEIKMLKIMVIGYWNISEEERIELLKEYTCKINSWSVCDSGAVTFKIKKDDKKIYWEFIKGSLMSKYEFVVRFGIVLAIYNFIEEEYVDEFFSEIEKITHNGYYVKMAIAWAVSVCYGKYPKETESYLRASKLDKYTFNKIIQKISESNIPDKEYKKIIKGLKRENE